MVLDDKRETSAILVDLDESGFPFFATHVPSNGNEIPCWVVDGEGSKNDNQLIIAVNAGQSSNVVGICWDGRKIALCLGNKT